MCWSQNGHQTIGESSLLYPRTPSRASVPHYAQRLFCYIYVFYASRLTLYGIAPACFLLNDRWTREVNGKKGLFPASYVKLL